MSSSAHNIPTYLEKILAEQRKTERFPLHVDDALVARLESKTFSVELTVIDISPFGIGAVTELPESAILLGHGEAARISVDQGGQTLVFDAILVNKRVMRVEGRNLTRIGLMIAKIDDEPTPGSDRRKSKRNMLMDVARIACYCDDPVYLGQQTLFEVMEVGYGGLSMTTSARNKYFLPEIALNLQVLIPGKGSQEVDVIVKSIRTTDNGSKYVIGCQFVNPSNSFLRALADFCLAFSTSVTMKELRDAGFPISVDSSAIAIRTGMTEEEMMKSLQLRLRAHQHAGRLAHVKDHTEMLDRYDEYARHVVAKVGSEVVGAARVVINNGDRKRSEYQTYVELPAWLWEGGFVEVSKACTDPEYRESSVFLNMCAEFVKLAVAARVKYLVAVCPDPMLKVYHRLGFRQMGHTFEYQMDKAKLNILFYDVMEVLNGRHMYFFYWVFTSRHIVPRLIREKKMKSSWLLQAKLLVARLCYTRVIQVLEKKIKVRRKASG